MSYARERLEYSLLVSVFFAFLKVTGGVDMSWVWVVAPVALSLGIDAIACVFVNVLGGYPEGFWGEGEAEGEGDGE